ncbi:glycosyltransferase family 2 protein [Pedobacter changchengzhani]|uniref:Glycosyltransferase family 2 protein n=1 Tax=Pedobacter changchengzhani TaxID=2529274 RepID=A0A4R5MJE1_9SPHI|nr:glycosyltransferase family 2 protein [Pedobacter changchengzhani]TDG35305.1 glycosyltransferase family 2 protein [Pedobacter changchengzhani]
MPKVTVIIPNYNHAKFLEQRIDSVITQTYQDFEIIILDDCSTDNSKNIIERYRGNSKVKEIVYNTRNSGSAFKQWEKGISLAKGEYIWIAESDDFADIFFIETLLECFTTQKDIGIAFCNSNWINDKNEIGISLSLHLKSRFALGNKEIITLLYYNTIQNVSSALIKTNLAKKYTSQLWKFRSCGDWLFYIQILSESNLYYTEKILNNFRWYHDNISNSAFKNGLWITEGTKLLSLLNPKTIKLPRRELHQTIKMWLSKIWGNNGLDIKARIKSTIDIATFYIRFAI